MTIDKIGGINNIQAGNDVKKTAKVNDIGTDSVHISEESKSIMQREYLLNIVKNSPDIREDKVIEAKEKLKLYDSNITEKNKVIESLAESLTASMFGEDIF